MMITYTEQRIAELETENTILRQELTKIIRTEGKDKTPRDMKHFSFMSITPKERSSRPVTISKIERR